MSEHDRDAGDFRSERRCVSIVPRVSPATSESEPRCRSTPSRAAAAQGEALADPERFVFVRDGFYFWAFLFAPLWLLWHRLWLVAADLSSVVVACSSGAALWPARRSGAESLVMAAAFAPDRLRGGTLRRWTLARRGWSNARLRRRRRPGSGRAAFLRALGRGAAGRSSGRTAIAPPRLPPAPHGPQRRSSACFPSRERAR